VLASATRSTAKHNVIARPTWAIELDREHVGPGWRRLISDPPREDGDLLPRQRQHRPIPTTIGCPSIDRPEGA
jgi:hypothetical protein